MPKEYSYHVRDCHAVDKVALNSFRQKRAQWCEWLDDDPDHAIWGVLHSMVWRDTAFATISKMALDNSDGPLHSSLLGEALVNGHVAIQVLALRRLTDRGTDKISLHRLIQDVKSNWHLLTRENFVCFDGLPYDYRAAEREYWKDKEYGVARWVDTTGPLAYGTSQLLHGHFDKMSGVGADRRSRSDVLPKSLIQQVEGWLLRSGAVEISQWSHAYLAHAGSAPKREEIAHIQITNNKIAVAIREMARVAEALSGNILYIGGRTSALMPVAQFDVLDRLEKPVASKANVTAAAVTWEEKSREWDGALSDVRDALLAR